MVGDPISHYPNRPDDDYMDLLWEWWITSTQALVDTIGSEAAMKALRPYYLNANTAAIHILSEYASHFQEDPFIVGRFYQFGSETWLGGSWDMWATPSGYVAEARGCKTRGQCPELCQLVCHEIVPETVIVKGLFKGDDHCLIALANCDWEESLRSSQLLQPLKFSKEEMMAFRMQYVGESWVFTTRAFIDTMGTKVALEKLRMYMRHSGLNYGIRVGGGLRECTPGIEIIRRGHRLHQRSPYEKREKDDV